MTKQPSGTTLLALLAVFGAAFAAADSLEASPISSSSLSGYVYVDEDFDGIRDPLNEWVLPDIELILTRADDPSAAVLARTDQNGFYHFMDLDEGVYTITQPEIPSGYLNVKLSVGQLLGIPTDDVADSFPGVAVNYDQQNGIPPHIERIQFSEPAVHGVDYNFGQIWLGKAWYLTHPPGGRPPTGVPEPASLGLFALGGLLLAARRLTR